MPVILSEKWAMLGNRRLASRLGGDYGRAERSITLGRGVHALWSGRIGYEKALLFVEAGLGEWRDSLGS